MPSVVETQAPHLRVSATKAESSGVTENLSTRITPPETSSVDDHFFWTYTEEPHRSRRQAIIKAHPEVCAEKLLQMSVFRLRAQNSPLNP